MTRQPTCPQCAQPVDPKSCVINIGIPSGEPTHVCHGCFDEWLRGAG